MEYSLVEGSNATHKCYLFMNKSFQFLVLLTFFSLMYSYFSGFPLFFYYNLHFSTFIFPLFGHALDRKFMFLLCNAILAFLAKNVNFTHSSAQQLTDQLPPPLKLTAPPENEDHPSDDVAVTEEQDQIRFNEGDLERKTSGIVPECADWEYYDDEFDDSDEDYELQESTAMEATEQVTDARVSTEELNQKFEEFIRKMKEDIRVEAQQPLVTV